MRITGTRFGLSMTELMEVMPKQRPEGVVHRVRSVVVVAAGVRRQTV